MWFLRIIAYILGTVAIVLTVLPFFRFGAWWIRIGDFPRMQITFLCGLVALFFGVVHYPLTTFEIIFLVSLGLCAAYQFYCILPYLPFYPKQVEAAESNDKNNIIKLLISNVLIENKDADKLLAIIKKESPDVIILDEPDHRWMDDVASLDSSYPYSVKYPLDNAYGIALFSRLKLENPEVKFLVQNDIPSIFTGVRLNEEVSINLFCIHPRPPFPTENDRSNERDAELIMVGKMIENISDPTIIAGDLNDVAWSRTTKLFQRISNLLDPRIGRGMFNSFHADYWFIRFPLDHVFHSNHFRVSDIRRLPSVGSDHFPILIALSYEPSAELTQEKPEASENEEIQADEIIHDV